MQLLHYADPTQPVSAFQMKAALTSFEMRRMEANGLQATRNPRN